jgi:hypothetical protein
VGLKSGVPVRSMSMRSSGGVDGRTGQREGGIAKVGEGRRR